MSVLVKVVTRRPQVADLGETRAVTATAVQVPQAAVTQHLRNNGTTTADLAALPTVTQRLLNRADKPLPAVIRLPPAEVVMGVGEGTATEAEEATVMEDAITVTGGEMVAVAPHLAVMAPLQAVLRPRRQDMAHPPIPQAIVTERHLNPQTAVTEPRLNLLTTVMAHHLNQLITVMVRPLAETTIMMTCLLMARKSNAG